MPTGSKLDHVYRRILMTKFFTKGWGKPDNLKRLFAFRRIVCKRETCYKLVPNDYPVSIVKEEVHSDCKILQGQFTSPFVKHLPGLLPKESETAHFQVILPKKWNSEHYKPICLHLAGTGDHGFWRRRQIMAKPLLKSAGIGALLLENPFYGLRKPKDQVRSSLHNVTDIFVMGGCLILESLALFHWCERNGFGPLGISGLSMGGHMASLAATNWPKPLVLVPCLSWSSASPVFTEGVMSGSINWDLLESQYFEDVALCEEIRHIIHKEEDAFRAGQEFAKHYPHSMTRVEELDKQRKEEITFMPRSSDLLPSNAQSGTSEKNRPLSGKNVPNFISAGLSPQATTFKEVQAAVQENFKEQYVPSETVSKQTVELLDDRSKEKLQSLPETAKQESSKIDKFSFLKHFYKTKEKLIELTEKRSEQQLPKNASCSLTKHRDREAYQFMRGIMDECTHLQNFDIPVDTSLIIAVCAKDDAYVPRESSTPLHEIWPGAEIRMLNAGHVSAYVLGQNTFRKAIMESFERLKTKYNWEERSHRCT
ncbi:hypothetical protein R5R35_000109 [Gryllus longicercus]|uniref:Protein ABHD18 n=1 Tax=Gryllus longicercus TaxID=2509291 RepID=A0AAN9VVB6_9ORTH